MSLLERLPEIQADSHLAQLQFDLRPDAIEEWDPEIQAASSGSDSTISIYGPIGATFDGGGITAKTVSAALRNIGSKPVTVNINSPGGSYYEGITIYNLLRQHPGKVTTCVLGLAASAASVIAMSGDDILMGEAANMLIHNAWGAVIGNRHDFAKAIVQLEPVDAAMAKLYSARSGKSASYTAGLMDAESKFSADQALSEGLATGKLDNKMIAHDRPESGNKKAMAQVESALIQAGYSRTARRDLFKSFFPGTPSAASSTAMPSAGNEVIAAALRATLKTIKGE